MIALKRVFALAAVVIAIRYISVYYYTAEFNHFVQQQAQRTRLKEELKQDILSKAKFYALPVKDDNITITTGGAVVRVNVDYRVPVDLLIFRHELKFRSIGSGLLRK